MVPMTVDAGDDLQHLISAALRCELGHHVSVLASRRDRRRNRVDTTGSGAAATKRLSGNARAKLAKIQKAKADKAVRAALLESIGSRSLTQVDQRLLQSSGRIGQGECKRDIVKRHLCMERAGLRHHHDQSHLVSIHPASSPLPDTDFHHPESPTPLPSPSTSITAVLESATIVLRPASGALVRVSDRSKRRRQVVLDVNQQQPINDSFPTYAIVAEFAPEPSPIATPPLLSLPEPADLLSKRAPIIVPAVPDATRFVAVHRPESIESVRRQLPVYMEEQSIMEAINDDDIVLICGATGSGKTTQIPQFLFEGGYGSRPGRSAAIAITQPRRVAAMAMAARVRYELADHGHRVAYQIRYDAHEVRPDTAVKFMTDGVLLREIQSDFLLRAYSVVIIDEAHERSLNTDVLIGLLSRIVPLRRRDPTVPPLKLIIMSATLRVEDFADNRRLFPSGAPPIVEVAGRQHPVTLHFSRRTPCDYITAAINKICQIHSRLPAGGILAFVSGKRDINLIVNALNKRLKPDPHLVAGNDDRDQIGRDRFWDNGHDPIDADDDVFDDRRIDDDDDGTVSDLDCDGDEEALADDYRPCVIVALHAMLSPSDQARVFAPLPSPQHRLIVIATNVAETSLTLPDIKYVVDTGREKRTLHDPVTGLSALNIALISRPSADQRAGRAGRTGPGHVYRLYSRAVYDNELAETGSVEIEQAPIDATVLALKAMSIDDMEAFPFPTCPPPGSIRAAIRLLTILGAVDTASPLNPITRVGRLMASLPLSPRYARIMAVSDQQGCRLYMIAVVAVLSLDTIFTRHPQQSPGASFRHVRQEWADPMSDVLGALAVVLAHGFAPDPDQFCHDNYVRPRAMFEIAQLRQQLHDRLGLGPVPSLGPASSDQRVLLCQMIGAGFGDQVARRHPSIAGAYQIATMPDQPVYLDPDSDLARSDPQPELVVYRDLVHSETRQIRIRGLTRIRARHLYRLCPQLCEVGRRPRSDRPAKYDATRGLVQRWHACSYGPGRWPLPDVLMDATANLS